MAVEQHCSYLHRAQSTLYKLAQEGKVLGQNVWGSTGGSAS